MDLKRVALGSYTGSLVVAQRFLREALLREKEVNKTEIHKYLRRILKRIKSMSVNDSETALLYSTLIQNYTQTFL